MRTIKTSRGIDYTRLSAMLATLELRGVLTKMPKSHPQDLPTYTVTRAELQARGYMPASEGSAAGSSAAGASRG